MLSQEAKALVCNLQCEIHQADHKSWCMMEMADKPMCFAIGVGVVKGDQSTAVFRGSNDPLGRRTDRSSLAGSHYLPSARYSSTLYISL